MLVILPAVSVFPSGYPFFQTVQSAVITNTIMAADYPAAFRAFPFLLFLQKKPGMPLFWIYFRFSRKLVLKLVM